MTQPRVPDFDALYEADPDPWGVASSPYEVRKRAIVLALLARQRYSSAWDPACGTGHLISALADRCDTVYASDTSERAVAATTTLFAHHEQVRFERLTLPARPTTAPDAGFALVVLAEFLYYLAESDRRAALNTVLEVTAGDGEILAVHWRHHPHDGWLAGSEVQAEVAATLLSEGWSQRTHLDEPDFVCDSWVGPNHVEAPAP